MMMTAEQVVQHAFTQGACMSSIGSEKPGSNLWKHELVHVWQNRILGPFFWFTYVGWMIVMFVASTM